MYIFLDESGTFTIDACNRSVGVLGALVATESQLPLLEQRYAQLRPLLPKDTRGEVKGKLLGESDTARVIDVARRSGLIYEATVVDLLPEHAKAIEQHRKDQCEGLTKRLTDKHRASGIAGIHELRTRLERMPLQLYVQSVATFDLLGRTLQHATTYHSQREPDALACFRWIIDAKDSNAITPAEDWWAKIVKPYMQARSVREPFLQLEGGDYSHMPTTDVALPKYLVEEFPHLKGKTGLWLNALFDDIEFSPRAIPGLELVDVLTNALRRGLRGRLAERGWCGIAGLMIHRKGPTYVHPIGFGPSGREVDAASDIVYRRLGTGGRSMLV